jgi:hypothetical protein
MIFTVNLRGDGEAFDYGNKETEVARILEATIEKIELGSTAGVLKDINGNSVGEWFLR